MPSCDASSSPATAITRVHRAHQHPSSRRFALADFLHSTTDFRSTHPALATQAHGVGTARAELIALSLDTGEATVRWAPSDPSTPRVLVALMGAGRVRIESTGGVINRPPGTALALPSPGQTTVHLLGGPIECVLLSVSIDTLAESPRRFDSATTLPPLSMRRMTPLYTLLRTFIATPPSDGTDHHHLTQTLPAIIDSVVEAIAQGSPAFPTPTLSRRARRFVDENYTNATLTTASVAAGLGVSARTLQAAFAAEQTTLSAELREVRTRAVRRIQEEHPHIPLTNIAAMCGFSSVSAMYRSLRAAEPSPGPGMLSA